MPHDVFISYSTRDLEQMLDIYSDLRMQGLSVWIDKQGILVGESSWRDAIADALKTSRCVVVLLSPHAANSFWVKQELAFAQMHGIPIFPVLLHGDLKDAVPFGFALSQWVDLRTSEDMLRLQLFPQLATHLGKVLPDAANVPSSRTLRQDTETIREIECTTRAARDEMERKQQAANSAAVRTAREEADAKAAQLEAIRQKAAEAELAQRERQRVQELGRQLAEAQAKLDALTPTPEDEAAARAEHERLAQLEAENRRLVDSQRAERQRIQALEAENARLNAERKAAPKTESIQPPPAKPIAATSTAAVPSPIPTLNLNSSRSASVPTVRRLSAWDPLDWLRLLGWVFSDRSKMNAHDDAYGEDARKWTGAWLASTLVWLPLLIPTLAVAVGAVEVLDGVEGVRWLWAAVIFGVLITVWGGVAENKMAVGVAGVVAVVFESDARFAKTILALLLVASYAVLIWIYWLGGWRVLAGGGA